MSGSEFPIAPYHEVFYISALQFCTESALASAQILSECLSRIESGDTDVDTLAVLDQLQNIINQSGAISRFFWPVENACVSRGEALRAAYSLADDSPLRSRQLRNLVEHFDEYLDDYLRNVSAGIFTPHYFGPEPEQDGVPRHYFKAYYFDRGIFEILGRRYELAPIVLEIQRIDQALRNSPGGRFPNI